MKDDNIENAAKRLLQYVEKEQFRGYDPYDLLNSPFPFHWFGKMVQAVVVQAGKLLPFNPRPMLGVKKDYVPKGLGLLLSAYCNFYNVTKESTYLEVAERLFLLIKQSRSPGYDEYCWGCNFVWANPHNVLPKYKPSSVVTSVICHALYEYYKITGSHEVKDIIGSSAAYINKYLHRTETTDGVCLSYSEEDEGCCYNATLFSAELLAIQYALSPNPDNLELTNKIISFVVAHQQEDGHWNYSIDLSTGKERKQIDFHQGFILCSLYRICKNAGINRADVDRAIRKGLHYYMTRQFKSNGQSHWRIPKEFPIDIHNQAQGIITFSLLAEYGGQYLDFAKKIMEWTNNNMLSKRGYYHYRIFKAYTIRTPFIRWSNSWMALASSELISADKRATITPPINTY